MAAFKYYTLSCVIVTNLVYEVAQRDDYTNWNWQDKSRNSTLTFAFSLLFFGNLVDNLRGHQKQMIISLEVAFGSLNLIQASLEYYFYQLIDDKEAD